MYHRLSNLWISTRTSICIRNHFNIQWYAHASYICALEVKHYKYWNSAYMRLTFRQRNWNSYDTTEHKRFWIFRNAKAILKKWKCSTSHKRIFLRRAMQDQMVLGNIRRICKVYGELARLFPHNCRLNDIHINILSYLKSFSLRQKK